MMWAIFAALFFISLHKVISQCPENCQSCSDTNVCLSCKLGNWGATFGCINTCSNYCANSECDDNGYCYACVNGRYGPACKQDCQLCKNGECGLRECNSGCNDGYFQSINGDYSYCYSCQDNCQQCRNFTYCTLCHTGYYIVKYTLTTEPKRAVATCITCQANNVCDECSKLLNCLQCSYMNGTLSCEHCIEGYALDNNHQCVKNVACSEACLNGCAPDGVCNGCIDERTGNTCQYFCAGSCSKCSQTNQFLCQSCKHGFYTSTCDISCPPNCATRQCGFNNGSCLNGCLTGFWGDKCEYICSDHCTLSECNRDGACSHGCTAAYDGLYCNVTTTTTTTTLITPSLTSGLVPSNTSSVSSTTTTMTTLSSSSSSSELVTFNTRNESCKGVDTVVYSQEGRSSFGPVIGGAVAGAVVITAFLVGSIAYFLHRRSSSFGSVLGGAVTGAVVITALLVGSIAFFLHRRSSLKIPHKELQADTMYYNTSLGHVGTTANDETGNGGYNVASEIRTIQAPETSTYEMLSATKTEHAYSGL